MSNSSVIDKEKCKLECLTRKLPYGTVAQVAYFGETSMQAKNRNTQQVLSTFGHR